MKLARLSGYLTCSDAFVPVFLTYYAYQFIHSSHTVLFSTRVLQSVLPISRLFQFFFFENPPSIHLEPQYLNWCKFLINVLTSSLHVNGILR